MMLPNSLSNDRLGWGDSLPIPFFPFRQVTYPNPLNLHVSTFQYCRDKETNRMNDTNPSKENEKSSRYLRRGNFPVLAVAKKSISAREMKEEHKRG
jgi:hypothetical protein